MRLVLLLLQIGADCPDVLPSQLKAAWGAVQSLVKQDLLSAGHDISDGGVATTLLEMAFAGGCSSGSGVGVFGGVFVYAANATHSGTQQHKQLDDNSTPCQR